MRRPSFLALLKKAGLEISIRDHDCHIVVSSNKGASHDILIVKKGEEEMSRILFDCGHQFTVEQARHQCLLAGGNNGILMRR